ncbi:CoA transferase [Burkholderia sp. SFA1]|nr:CoA transferase [Burkholderia sp. SFA1]
MTPSLTGLRVLDLTRLLPGPIATLRLAELGADVLKIEPPGEGDYARAMLQSDADRQSGTPSAFYRIVNRGKRQLTLDLKTGEGRAKLIELARDESFRPSVMARLGVGYDVLREANPKLVYCAITGFGAEGPFAQKAGHDLNYLAYAGVLDQLAARDGTPVAPNFQLADLLGGALAAVMEILAAAWQVARGGEGRCLNVSMTHAIHTHNVMAHIALANGNEASTRAGAGLLNGGAPCYDVYRTRDDRFIAVGALELKFWQTLCNALGRPDWAAQHWSLGQGIGGTDAARLSAELAACFRERTRDEWMALLEPLDCCVAPVLTPAEAAAHPLFEG